MEYTWYNYLKLMQNDYIQKMLINFHKTVTK